MRLERKGSGRIFQMETEAQPGQRSEPAGLVSERASVQKSWVNAGR